MTARLVAGAATVGAVVVGLAVIFDLAALRMILAVALCLLLPGLGWARRFQLSDWGDTLALGAGAEHLHDGRRRDSDGRVGVVVDRGRSAGADRGGRHRLRADSARRGPPGRRLPGHGHAAGRRVGRLVPPARPARRAGTPAGRVGVGRLVRRRPTTRRGGPGPRGGPQARGRRSSGPSGTATPIPSGCSAGSGNPTPDGQRHVCGGSSTKQERPVRPASASDKRPVGYADGRTGRRAVGVHGVVVPVIGVQHGAPGGRVRVMALTEVPQLRSAYFPTRRRCSA